MLYPEYVGTFARAGTRFSVITPQISAAGVEHLDTLFQAYINVEPGRGPARRDFEIQDTTISDSRYIDGLNIVVEAPEAGRLASVRRSCSADWKSGRLPDCRWGRCLTG